MREQKISTARDMDVLGCVYRFVLAYIWDKDHDPYKPEQVMRSWQSLATAPPFNEYCVLSHLSSIRHGTNVDQYDFDDPVEDHGLRERCTLVEHSVQVDFFGSDSQSGNAGARRRATLLEMIANSFDANDLFAALNPDLGCLYADPVMSFAEVDERRRIRERHSVTLHLSQTLKHQTAQRYMDAVMIRSASADKFINNEV